MNSGDAMVIAGVAVRRLIPIEDDRGAVVEAFRPTWGVGDTVLHGAVSVTVRPRQARGWFQATAQSRFVHCLGAARWGLWDRRSGSPTAGMIDDLVCTERNRYLLVLPPGIAWAVENLDASPVIYVSFPGEGVSESFVQPVSMAVGSYTFSGSRG